MHDLKRNGFSFVSWLQQRKKNTHATVRQNVGIWGKTCRCAGQENMLWREPGQNVARMKKH